MSRSLRRHLEEVRAREQVQEQPFEQEQPFAQEQPQVPLQNKDSDLVRRKTQNVTSKSNSSDKNLDQVCKDLNSMLESGKFSDCVLVVEKKELHAHKLILAARSPVFSAMFEHDCEEKRKSRVQITDVQLDVFEELLRYVYSGKVNELDKYAGELLEAADKYQMDCLKQICEKYINANLNNESVANILILSDMRNMAELKQKCIKHITCNAKQVMATEGWKVMVEKRPDLLAPLFAELASKHENCQPAYIVQEVEKPEVFVQNNRTNQESRWRYING